MVTDAASGFNSSIGTDSSTTPPAHRSSALFDFRPYFLTGSDRIVLQVLFLSTIIVAVLMGTTFAIAHTVVSLLA